MPNQIGIEERMKKHQQHVQNIAGGYVSDELSALWNIIRKLELRNMELEKKGLKKNV